MYQIGNYILESTSILGIFIIIYRLALNRYESLEFNRAYLLIAIAISAVVPLFELPINLLPAVDASQGDLDGTAVLMLITKYPEDAKISILSYILNIEAVTWVYLIGVTIFIIRLIKGSIQIKQLITKYRSISIDRKNNLIYLPKEFRSFSFLKYIFISRDRYSSSSQVEDVITHERAHVELWHSLDSIIIEIVLIFEWFNPFAWYLRREIKEIHEFQADRKTLKSVQSIGRYKALLLFETTGIYPNVASSMADSLTKKRFTMMKKVENKRLLGLKQISALTAAIAVSILFCIKVNATDSSAFNTTKNSSLAEEYVSKSTRLVVKNSVSAESDKEFPKPDVQPKFSDGMRGLMKFLSGELIFPPAYTKEKIGIKIYVKFTVSKDGKVKDPEIFSIKGIDTESNDPEIVKKVKAFTDESLRVINNMPAWTPAKKDGKNVDCYYQVPINFVIL